MDELMRIGSRGLVLMLFCGASSAFESVVAYEEVPHSTVTSLATCGHWQFDGQSGRFRILQAYLYGGTRLFVDMVRPNEQGTWLEVMKGFTFAEINTTTWRSSCPRCVACQMESTELW
jgi:hypothetical protein